jgi:hypothetical protein
LAGKNIKENTAMEKRSIIEKALEKGNGILNLEPAWVCRDFLPPGKRLGLKEEEYCCGERGYICERWLGSVTYSDNRISFGQLLTINDYIIICSRFISNVHFCIIGVL